ncbi:Maf family protein [Succinimonas sp.]|uniref:Maf family protein n=1 Tax=Succinimonas sp. TaxID=1936151 RepID=UPI00386C1DF9
MTYDLILASGSPRRREILTELGFSFRVVRPEIDESRHPGESPGDYVKRLSLEKARAVSRTLTAGNSAALASPSPSPLPTVLAADTALDFAGDIIGKPASREEFFRIMTRLSGKEHRVITGFTVLRGADSHTEAAVSLVRFHQLSPDEIAWYWNTGEPCDKAGGYAIQGLGRKYVREYEGSLSNIIGLPRDEVTAALALFGIYPAGQAGE